MEKVYEVYINNKKVKEFPTKEQADMYLLETGHVYSCKFGKFLENNCKVKEVQVNRKCIEDNTPHAESTVLFKDLDTK